MKLADPGIEVSEVFHDSVGVFHCANGEGHRPGLDPRRSDYASFASFSDPDGNSWVLQQVVQRATDR